MAMTDESADRTETGSTADVPVDCPLCGWRADDRTDVYQHMMVSHRKSELSRTVLEAGGTANEQDGQSGVGDAELRSDDIRS